MNTSTDALDALLADLDIALADPTQSAKVAGLLERYAAGRSNDWRRFALFEANTYARNLVRRSDLYELIVLCWGPGQCSPIHDHASQRCWMGVLDGRVAESMFHAEAGSPTSLRPGTRREFERGQVAFITDDVGWHRIEPSGGAAAVTLHLYSRPIRECRIFDESTGRPVTKRMRYHSVGGVVQSLGA